MSRLLTCWLNTLALRFSSPELRMSGNWSSVYSVMCRKIRGGRSTRWPVSFPALCALIETVDLVITNNTGPMHIAAAVKTAVAALFALTNPPEQWGPWQVPQRLLNVDVPCRICYSRVCPYQHECLRLVTPQMVVDAARELLEEGEKEQ